MDSLCTTTHIVSDPILFWTGVLSVCAIINIFIAYWMLKATKKYTSVTEQIFLTSQRPYIGRTKFLIHLDDDKKLLRFDLFIENFGSVPAKKVYVILKLFINNTPQKAKDTEGKNLIIFPHSVHPINFFFDLQKLPDSYKQIIEDKLSVKFVTEIKYYGVTEKEYSTTETEIYKHSIKGLLKESGEWT